MAWLERIIWITAAVLLSLSIVGGFERHSLAVGQSVAAQCSEWR